MNVKWTLSLLAAAAAVAALSLTVIGGTQAHKAGAKDETKPGAMAEMKTADTAKGEVEKVVKSEEEWKKELTPEQYRVLRGKGTEVAFTGKYWSFKGDGTYVCAACGLDLFDSRSKYKSGTGWPSFFEPVAEGHVGENKDVTLGMVRTEIVCNRCGGHLGHVFEDGPQPTGLRYCVNSVSLGFKARDGKAADPNTDAKTATSDESAHEGHDH